MATDTTDKIPAADPHAAPTANDFGSGHDALGIVRPSEEAPEDVHDTGEKIEPPTGVDDERFQLSRTLPGDSRDRASGLPPGLRGGRSPRKALREAARLRRYFAFLIFISLVFSLSLLAFLAWTSGGHAPVGEILIGVALAVVLGGVSVGVLALWRTIEPTSAGEARPSVSFQALNRWTTGLLLSGSGLLVCAVVVNLGRGAPKETEPASMTLQSKALGVPEPKEAKGSVGHRKVRQKNHPKGKDSVDARIEELKGANGKQHDSKAAGAR